MIAVWSRSLAASEALEIPEARAPATGALRLVSSLRYRDWRYLWSGLMFAQAGEWMDHLAINWLVLVQTDSPLALGTVNLVRGLPNIVFSLAAGVVADRVDRRTLMIWTQIGGMINTGVLAALASAGVLDLWHIYALLVIRGTISAFNQPARASVLGDLVPRVDIANAIALHSATFNSTRMIGPAIAGFLIAAVGSAFVLWIHTAAFVVSIWTLLAMRTPPRTPTKPGVSPWGTFVDGITYVWKEPVVFMLLVIGVVPFVLGQPYQSMLPVFAKDVLLVGAQGLGLLTAASAAGGLVGAFLAAAAGDFRRKGLVMMAGMVSFALLIVAFAATPWPLVSAAFLFLVGASHQLYQTTNSTLVQVIVPSEYRGRVLGLHQMDRGFIPVGSFIAGAIAEARGAPFATGLMGSCLAVSGLAVLLFVPRMRRLE